MKLSMEKCACNTWVAVYSTYDGLEVKIIDVKDVDTGEQHSCRSDN